MLRKGSLLVEALIAILIISMAIGISAASSYNLIRKTYENKMIVDMSQILLNECEEVLATNQSRINDTTKTVLYGGNRYTVSIRKEVVSINSNFKFYRYIPSSNSYTLISKPADVLIQNVYSVTVRVTDSVGRYVETIVVPQQW